MIVHAMRSGLRDLLLLFMPFPYDSLFRLDPLFFSSSDDDSDDDEELLLLDELELDEEEDDEEDELLLLFFFLRFFYSRSSYITKPSSLLRERASSYFAGSCFSKRRSHLQASFFRPERVSRQTLSKLPSLQKFSVTAIVLSRLRTACHQPPGTKMHSPGCYIPSMIVRRWPSVALSLGNTKSK
jgi:hypothetical protein